MRDVGSPRFGENAAHAKRKAKEFMRESKLRRLITYIALGGGILIIVWVALGAYFRIVGQSLEPLVNHMLNKFEKDMPAIQKSFDEVRNADVHVVRDLQGTITLSGHGVPGGPLRVASLEQFRQVVASLPTPGTAEVRVLFEGTKSFIPPEEVLKKQEELQEILAQHGLIHPTARKGSGQKEAAPN